MDPNWPVCADCHLDYLAAEVVPFDEFVQSATLDDFQETIGSWQRASHLPDEFRRIVIQRIQAGIELKRAGSGQP
jgi:hypothetical protein